MPFRTSSAGTLEPPQPSRCGSPRQLLMRSLTLLALLSGCQPAGDDTRAKNIEQAAKLAREGASSELQFNYEAARKLQVAGFTEASLLFVEEVVNRDPSFRDIYFLRGFALQKSGRLEEAVISYQRQLQRFPGDSQSLFNLGHAQLSLGRPAQAISSFLEALRLDPTRKEAHYHLASCYGALGDAARAGQHAALYQQP